MYDRKVASQNASSKFFIKSNQNGERSSLIQLRKMVKNTQTIWRQFVIDKLSVFDHFMELMFEGLKSWIKRLLNGPNLWNFCMIAQWSSENLLRWGIPLFIQSMLSYAPRRNCNKWRCNILKWSHSHVDSQLENSCGFS